MLYWRLAMVLVLAFVVAGPERPVEADDQVTLRFGTLAVDGSRYMKDIRALSAEITKRTGGKVRIKWYPSGRLGDERAMVDLIREGRLDGGGFSDVGLSALVPQIRAWQYPGLFATYADVDRATEALGSKFRELFSDRDVVFAMWADLGFANVFSRDELGGWGDLSDHTLWFDAGEDAVVYATERLGLSAKAAPGEGGLASAISAGRATTWAQAPLYALAGSTHSSAGYLWKLRYRYVIGGLVIDRAAWSRMSRRQQRAFLKVCAAWEPKVRKRWRKESVAAIAAIEKSGVSLVEVSDADLETFRAEADSHREAFAERWKLGELIDEIARAAAD